MGCRSIPPDNITLHWGGTGEGIVYRVAGRSLCADRPIAALEPFAAGVCTLPPIEPPPIIDGPSRRIEGWIGGKMNTLSVIRSANGWSLTAERGGTYLIAASGSDVFCTHADEADPDFAVAMLLGPVLCTALALQRVFCLHASAALIEERALLFLGDSGAGKSSLAAYGERIGAWRRIGDDVTAAGEGIRVLPHFPQLKLPPEAQVGRDVPGAVPLTEIYLLDVPEDARAAITLEALSEREAAAALVRHTIAARVFSGALLAHHFDYCAALAARTGVVRVVYPHRREAMDEVIARIND